MYLRTLIGPYAGQVFDFSPEAARAMLADGRAVHPDADLDEEEAAAEALESLVEDFATGGLADTGVVPLVGETPTGTVLPAPVANKLNAAVRRKGRHG